MKRDRGTRGEIAGEMGMHHVPRCGEKLCMLFSYIKLCMSTIKPYTSKNRTCKGKTTREQNMAL